MMARASWNIALRGSVLVAAALSVQMTALSGAPIANAAVKIEPNGWQGRASPAYKIVITGRIDHQTRTDFLKAADDTRIKLTAYPIVELDSLGGDVPEAMAIGDAIRRAGLLTGVFEGTDECSSACALILASGVKRIVSGKIGIHRPRFDEALFARLSLAEAREKYERMADDVRRYLARMGMADGLYAAMLHVPSDDVRYLSEEECQYYGLAGEDPAWREWQRAKEIQTIGKEGYEVQLSFRSVYLACVNTSNHSPAWCNDEVSVLWQNAMEACPGADRVACAKAVEQQLLRQYR